MIVKIEKEVRYCGECPCFKKDYGHEIEMYCSALQDSKNNKWGYLPYTLKEYSEIYKNCPFNT